ncbi:MAG: class I tRNA ligase family protein, partial [Burkholderiales bacterium]
TDSRARRSAQNALFHIAHALIRMFAPILSFTAEEAWPFLPETPQDSVFLQQWHELPQLADTEALESRWERVLELRSDVSKQLEGLRVAGRIGSALAAEVELYVADEAARALADHFGEHLRFVLITSALRICTSTHAEAVPSRVEGIAVRVLPSSGTKCARCWHYRHDVAEHGENASLCGRCISNLYGGGEARPYA